MELVSSFCLLLLLAQAPAAAPRKPVPPRPAASKVKPAVAAAQAATTFLIRTLRVEGARQLPVEGILTVAGLKIGMVAEAPLFEAARERLLATGLFEQAGYRYTPTADNTGYDAVLLVTEIVPLLPYRFEELELTPAALTQALRQADPLFGDRLSATPVALKRYGVILTAALKAAGQEIPVAGRVMADGAGLVLVFRPDVPEPTISQVGFSGNEVLPTALLQTTINGTAIGGIYKEERMREYLNNAIRPLYEARGRVAVTFSKITSTTNPENKGLDVMVEVLEGPSFDLGEVKVVAGGEDVTDLERAAGLKSGDLANMDNVQEALTRVRTALRKLGYVKNEVTLERRPVAAAKPEEKSLLHLTFQVKPGPQYRFRKLEIAGLDILNEPQLRKMWALETGQAFNGDYPDFFLKRVRDDGLFDDLGETKAVVALDDAALRADVKLVFGKAERKPAPKKKRPF